MLERTSTPPILKTPFWSHTIDCTTLTHMQAVMCENRGSAEPAAPGTTATDVWRLRDSKRCVAALCWSAAAGAHDFDTYMSL